VCGVVAGEEGASSLRERVEKGPFLSRLFVCLFAKPPHRESPRDFRKAYDWCAVVRSPGPEASGTDQTALPQLTCSFFFLS